MKDPTYRTKVVIRHLPPTLSQSAFFEQIDSRFSERYGWSSFRPGRTSHKGQKHARAYVNFNSPEDVIDFAEFFNGHVFVNEKGAQFKAIVEYSPSQRVPSQGSKKDGREGTIFKDPEYVEFLEKISKPVENLPSADIQLERREAERAGIQEPVVITPLMEFVRRRRASKTGSQVSSDGKSGGRIRTSSSSSKPRSMKQSAEKKRYILKTGGKGTNGKDKSAYTLLPRRDDQSESSGKKLSDHEGNGSDVGKKILLLKGKELEIPHVSGGMTEKKVSAPSENSSASASLKLNHRHDVSGRIIRSILSKGQSSSPSYSEQKVQILNSEKGKRPPRPSIRSSSSHASISDQSPIRYSIKKRPGDDRSVGNESAVVVTSHEKHERRSRNKERHDSGIWAPRRSDASHGNDDRNSQTFSVSHEGNSRDTKGDILHLGNRGDIASPTGGLNSSQMENGSHRPYSRRNSLNTRDDSSPNDVKSSKRGAAGHGSHEKQVWVQKSASGS